MLCTRICQSAARMALIADVAACREAVPPGGNAVTGGHTDDATAIAVILWDWPGSLYDTRALDSLHII